jgi:hypothetical protein
VSIYPRGWQPWGKRKRWRLRWGDPEVLLTGDGEIGCCVRAEQLIVLHPHLRRLKNHDLCWDVKGHEFGHAAFPRWPEYRVLKHERALGQLLHDLSGCRKCPK